MTYTAQHVSSRREQRMVVWQPADAATAQLIDLGQPQGAGNLCLPIAGFRRFTAQTCASLLVGNGVIAFKIYAATAAAGTGATVVVSHAVGTAPDAEGDSLFLECDVDQIRAALPTATHVGVWIDCQHNDDETTVCFTREEPDHLYPALTSDYTAA
jgi:hypothetical protein